MNGMGFLKGLSSLGYASNNMPAQKESLDITNSNKSSTSVNSSNLARSNDFKALNSSSVTRRAENLASEASIVDQDSLTKVSESGNNACMGQDLPRASLEQSSDSVHAFYDMKEKILSVKQSCLHLTASNLHLSEAKACDSDHIGNKQQLKSLPCVVEACTQYTDKVEYSPRVASASQIANQQEDPVMPSTLSMPSRSSCQINPSVHVLPKNVSGLNCQVVPGSCKISSEMNSEQPLQESRASSKHSHFEAPPMSHAANLSKLLSSIKNLANQQRRSMGVGKTFPCLFESFRSSVFKMGMPFPFLLPNSDDHMHPEKLNTTENIMSLKSTKSYLPCTVNNHTQVAAEELTMQGHFCHQEDFEKVGASKSPISPSSSKALLTQINNLPCQEFQAMPLIGLQGQAQEMCSVPKNSSILLHSVEHPYYQDQTSSLLDINSCSIPNHTCISTKQKSDYVNAVLPSCEGLVSDTLIQKNPLPNQVMEMVIENGNEEKETVRNSPSLKESRGISEEDPGQSVVGRMLNSLQKQDCNYTCNEASHSSLDGNGICQTRLPLQQSEVSQLGSFINDKLIALQVAKMYQRMMVSGTSPGIPSHQFIPGKGIQHFFPGAALVPENSNNIKEATIKESKYALSAENLKVASFSSNSDDSIDQYSSSMSNIESQVACFPKKRKRVIMPLTTWHLEITEPGDGIPTISDSEFAWAAATNRLPEKNDGDGSYDEEGGSVSRAKRRLICATQTMQQLLQPLPIAIMCGKASVEYDSVIYTFAKTVLEDACKLSSCLRSSGNFKIYKILKANSLLRECRSFMGKAKDLENELLRLEASICISELRSESRNLERLSITNRLAKHHARTFPVNSEKPARNSSSDCTLLIQKPCPYRYVTAVPMPKDIPEGVLCFSL